MTELLEQVIAKVSRLPDGVQDRYASWLLEEIALDQQAEATEETLAAMFARARTEYERGETKPMSKDCVIVYN